MGGTTGRARKPNCECRGRPEPPGGGSRRAQPFLMPPSKSVRSASSPAFAFQEGLVSFLLHACPRQRWQRAGAHEVGAPRASTGAAGALRDGDPPLLPALIRAGCCLGTGIFCFAPHRRHGGAKGSREGRDPREGLRAFRTHLRRCSVPPGACWPRWLGDTCPAGCAAADGPALPPFSLQQGKSSSTGNLLDKDDIAIPPPDYGMSSQAFPSQNVNTFKQRPYSVAVPAFSQVSPDCLQGFAGAGGGGDF